MIAAGTTSLITATAAGTGRAAGRGRSEAPDGSPEQVHLTWGDDPTRSVMVSWVSPGRAERPRVRIGQRVITAAERAFTDTLRGIVTWTYHARVDGLRPGATYGYAVTADNDANAADPFSATFTTAPEGRAAFRFTSFGDLATPSPAWTAYAVGAVETFQPLFHLLNGDLSYAGPGQVTVNPPDQAQAWRDFGNNVQASAANRPWLPVPGDHDLGPGDGEQGPVSYLTRYTLPSNGMDGLEGRWYAFRVGTALFVCLSGDDVAYQDAGAPAADTFNRSTRIGGTGAGGTGTGGTGPLPPSRQAASRRPQALPCTCAATRAARRPGGLSRPLRRHAQTLPSTGSSSSFTSAPARPRRTATVRTWASGVSGYRCSIPTRWTSCCPGTTAGTSAPFPSAASTQTQGPTP